MIETFLVDVLKFAPRQVWAFEQFTAMFKELFANFSLQKLGAYFMAMIEMLGLMILDTPVTPRGEELDLTGYSLVFEDEFEGDTLNTDVWKYRSNGARRGGYNAASQVEVKDGNMIMTAEYLTDGTYGEGWYAGMISLQEKYCKGYYEIRCKVNAEPEFWSAFWLQSSAPYTASVSKGGIGGAEIDIFESQNTVELTNRNSVTQTIHCAGVDGVEEGFQSFNLGAFKGNDIYNEYNTYGLMWTDTEYIFYINGVETRRTSFGNGVSEVPEEVIVSLEIPGIEQLNTLDKDTYKSEYIIDYVRIYQ